MNEFLVRALSTIAERQEEVFFWKNKFNGLRE
jgi:hypothetical protein